MYATSNKSIIGFGEFDAARTLLSLREAVVLAEISEIRVRKDIETGVLEAPFVTRINDSRLCTHWTYVFTLAAVYGNKYLPGAFRKRVLHEIGQANRVNSVARATEFVIKEWNVTERSDHGSLSKRWEKDLLIDIDTYVKIDYAKVVDSLRPRVGLYVYGLSRVEEREDVLGGEAVFKDTRVPVIHVGKMAEKGESVDNILEDFPSLTRNDVEFAKLYCRAHPPVGRPRTGSERTKNDAPTSA